MEYRWSQQLTEWFRNTPLGLEHGLVLSSPPASGALRLEFALAGDLQAELEPGERIGFYGAKIHYHYNAVYLPCVSK